MSQELLRPRGKRTNHKKGILQDYRNQKRKEAEERQAKYAKLPLEEKLKRAGKKEKRKLLLKQANEKGVK